MFFDVLVNGLRFQFYSAEMYADAIAFSREKLYEVVEVFLT